MKYDIDNLRRDPTDTEIEVCQYLRPNGRTRRTFASVSDKELVRQSRYMFVSAEELTTGQVAIYARYKHMSSDTELIEICYNGPETTTCLIKLLKNLIAREKKS